MDRAVSMDDTKRITCGMCEPTTTTRLTSIVLLADEEHLARFRIPPTAEVEPTQRARTTSGTIPLVIAFPNIVEYGALVSSSASLPSNASESECRNNHVHDPAARARARSDRTCRLKFNKRSWNRPRFHGTSEYGAQERSAPPGRHRAPLIVTPARERAIIHCKLKKSIAILSLATIFLFSSCDAILIT